MAKRNEARRIKYQSVLNAWGDTKLARKYRDNSWENIYADLGVKPVAKLPKAKEFSKELKKKRAKQYKEFLDLRDSIVASDVVYADYIKNSIQKGYKETTIKNKIKALESKRLEQNILSKKITWAKWSRADNMPFALQRLAIRLNRAKGREDSDHYGYIITYNSYIYGKPFSFYVDLYREELYGTEFYTFANRVRR